MHQLRTISLAHLPEAGEPEWLWTGFLARKAITLFAALAKAGKTTLIAHLLRDLYAGGGLVGPSIEGRTLILSEEPMSIWRRRQRALELNHNIHLIDRGSHARATPGEWSELVRQLAECVAEHGIELVIMDTLSGIWPVADENNAAEVSGALAPLRAIAEAGAAVLLVHHARKSGGGEATSIRGSSALTAFPDIVLELTRYAPSDAADPRRVLRSYGRFEETPAEQVVEWGEAGFRVVGDSAAARSEDIDTTIEQLLPASGEGLTCQDVLEAWPSASRPGKGKLQQALKRGAKKGRWQQFGSGVKGKPFRYLTGYE